MKTLKVTKARGAKLGAALSELEAHAAAAAAVWPDLSEERRDELLAHSPVLARLLALTAFARS